MFSSSRNHDPSTFAQALRQRRPRRRRPERPAGASPTSRSTSGPSSTPPSSAPIIASLAESPPDQSPNLPTTAAHTVRASSNTQSTLKTSAAAETVTIPPSPPSSTPGSQRLKPQPWATRSRRFSHPAIPSKKREIHEVDTPAFGAAGTTASARSAKRVRTIEPGTDRVRTSTVIVRPGGSDTFASVPPGLPKRDGCGLCLTPIDNQPRKQCQTCSDVYFCLKCSINSAVLHPGHVFKLVEPSDRPSVQQNEHNNRNQLAGSRHSFRSGPSSSRAESCQPRETPSHGIHAEIGGKAGQQISSQTVGKVDDEESRLMLRTVMRIPLCESCQTKLFDLRYECQDCPDTNFCSGCRLHQNGHTLKLVTSPIIISSWDDFDEDGEGAGDASSIRDGMDKDDDISTNPGSDGRGEDVGFGKIEQANIEDMVDNYGRGDAEEWVGSGTESIISSKECRPIELRSRPRKPPVKQPDIHYQDFAQIAKSMTKAIQRMEAVVHAAEDIMRTRTRRSSHKCVPKIHNRTRSRSSARTLPVPEALLDFPIDFATLDYDDDNEESAEGDKDKGSHAENSGSDSDRSSGRSPPPRKRIRHPPRQWSSKDRRRLAQLKQKGWADDRIGADLGRSASAVSQQWRKQKLSER